MKIILINPPNLSEKPYSSLSQPMGLASLAAVLRKEGHKVSIIDSVALGCKKSISLTVGGRTFFRIGLDYNEIASLIPKSIELVGITGSFTHSSYIVKPLISALKRWRKNLKIMLGGVFPSTLPVYASKMGADYIAVGEGEPIITSFAKGEDIKNIEGLYESGYLSKLDSEDISCSRGMVKNLDELPLPARDLLPFDLYIKSGSSGRGKGKFGASIHTSRGCPYNCTFCSVHSVFKRGYRARSAENIWKEIEDIIERFKIFHFEFEDDNLTLIKERSMAIFGKMAEWNRKYSQKITFVTPNGIRIDTLDKEMLYLMKTAGCERISLGLEHGDPEMLRLMNKKLNLEKVEEVVRCCKKFNIKIMIYLIIGFPGETLERWENSIKFAKKLKKINPDIVFDLHVAQALPKTALLDFCLTNGYLVGSHPDRLVLLGKFSNIVTPDFSPDDIKKRMIETDRILNNSGHFSKRILLRVKKFLGR